MHEQSADSFHRACQVSGGGGVQQLGALRILLGTLHVRIGRAVHDSADGVFADEAFHGLTVRDVEPQGIVARDVREEVAVRRGGRSTPEGMSQLPSGARDKNVHDL